ncbi:MAG: hypothetical protein Kow00121_38310 [Elainellaceae cyanobacterium]
MSSNTLKDLNHSRTAAKVALREALAAHDGDPRHEIVAAQITTLSALNPTPEPARSPLLDGDWQLISAPSFPQGDRLTDGRYCYTLGRLAFNMFQPQNLKVVIDQVAQPVQPIGEGSQRSHDIVVNFTTLNEDMPLQGIVRNLGVCEPTSDTVLKVQFTGGLLEPAEETDLALWQQVFSNASQPSRSSLKEWLQGQFLKFMFGLVPPDRMNPNTGRVEFQMKRSPKGSLTVLYLDEELRITRGHKETVLICERK